MIPETSSPEDFDLADIFVRLAERGRKLREAQKQPPDSEMLLNEALDSTEVDPSIGEVTTRFVRNH